MGEMIMGIHAGSETHELNKMFGNVDGTKRTRLARRILDIRGNIPNLLVAPTSSTYPPTMRRQRSLRLAATELARHVSYRRSDPGRGNQREFLRWLTWLEKDEANWAEAVKITKVLTHFVDRHVAGGVPPRVLFDWTEQAASLSIVVSPADYATTNPPTIDIMVNAPDAFHATVDDED